MDANSLLLEMKVIEKMFGLIAGHKTRRVTYFLSPQKVIRITRKTFNKKFPKDQEFVVSICKPNYRERAEFKKVKGKITMIVEFLKV